MDADGADPLTPPRCRRTVGDTSLRAPGRWPSTLIGLGAAGRGSRPGRCRSARHRHRGIIHDGGCPQRVRPYERHDQLPPPGGLDRRWDWPSRFPPAKPWVKSRKSSARRQLSQPGLARTNTCSGRSAMRRSIPASAIWFLVSRLRMPPAHLRPLFNASRRHRRVWSTRFEGRRRREAWRGSRTSALVAGRQHRGRLFALKARHIDNNSSAPPFRSSKATANAPGRSWSSPPPLGRRCTLSAAARTTRLPYRRAQHPPGLRGIARKYHCNRRATVGSGYAPIQPSWSRGSPPLQDRSQPQPPLGMGGSVAPTWRRGERGWRGIAPWNGRRADLGFGADVDCSPNAGGCRFGGGLRQQVVSAGCVGARGPPVTADLLRSTDRPAGPELLPQYSGGLRPTGCKLSTPAPRCSTAPLPDPHYADWSRDPLRSISGSRWNGLWFANSAISSLYEGHGRHERLASRSLTRQVTRASSR